MQKMMSNNQLIFISVLFFQKWKQQQQLFSTFRMSYVLLEFKHNTTAYVHNWNTTEVNEGLSSNNILCIYSQISNLDASTT